MNYLKTYDYFELDCTYTTKQEVRW